MRKMYSKVLGIDKNNHLGFGYIETILVVALSLVLATESFSLGSGFLQRNNLRNTRDVLISYLNSASTFSIVGKGGQTWGVHISSDKITQFQGASFSGRNAGFDTSYRIPGNVTVTPIEIIFGKYTGETNETAIDLIGNAGSSYTIRIDSEGIVSYE